MICKNCGKQIPDSALFCTYCGAKTEAFDTPASEDAPKVEDPAVKPVVSSFTPPPMPQPSDKKKIIIGVIVAVICVIVIATMFGKKSSSSSYSSTKVTIGTTNGS